MDTQKSDYCIVAVKAVKAVGVHGGNKQSILLWRQQVAQEVTVNGNRSGRNRRTVTEEKESSESYVRSQ